MHHAPLPALGSCARLKHIKSPRLQPRGSYIRSKITLVGKHLQMTPKFEEVSGKIPLDFSEAKILTGRYMALSLRHAVPER